MISLKSLLHGLSRSGAQNSASSRGPLATKATRVLLENALWPGATGKVSVLVGSRRGELLEALFERFPDLSGVLLLEAGLPEYRAVFARAAHHLNQRQLERTFVVSTVEPTKTVDFFQATLELFQFFRHVRAAPQGEQLVCDPELASNAAYADVLAAARDFCFGFSSALLNRFSGTNPELQKFFGSFGDFLSSHGADYHALKFHQWADDSLSDPKIDSLWKKIRVPPAPEIWRRNLEFLHATYPEVAARVSFGNLESIRVAVVPDVLCGLQYQENRLVPFRGDYPLIVRADGKRLSELNPLPSLVKLRDVCLRLDGAPICILGMVRHWADWMTIARVHRHVSHYPNWKPMTQLIEGDIPALAALLRAVELEPLFSSGVIHLSVGKSAEDFFERLGKRKTNPSWHLIGNDSEFSARVESILVGRHQSAQDSIPKLALQCEEVPERIRRFKEAANPLRIALFTSIYTDVLQYVTADLAEAFVELGHQVRVIQEETVGEQVTVDDYVDQLVDFGPDVLVLLNYSRTDQLGLIPATLPIVTWILDERPEHFDRKYINQIAEVDRVYIFDSVARRRYREAGYTNIGLLPFAVAKRLRSPPIASPAHSVAVLTHVTNGKVDYPNIVDLIEHFEERLGRLEQWPVFSDDCARLLDQSMNELGGSISSHSEQQKQTLAVSLTRNFNKLRVVDRLITAQLPIEIYGRGWEQYPRFAPYLRGVVRPGPELSAVYRNSKVVLHDGTNPHPRILEGFLAGGCVLVRDYAGANLAGIGGDPLELNRQYMYQNDAEMLALIQRAFEDEPWRQNLIASAQDHILSMHTYTARAQTILRDLGSH